jgi:hypothetical protein
MDDGGSRVQFPAGERNGSLLQIMQTGSGFHPDTYSMTDDGSFHGSEATRRKVDLYLMPRLIMPS